MRQFEITVENKVGKLSDVCGIICNIGVNIRAISTEDKNGTGVIKLITDDENLTRSVLGNSGLNYKEFEIVSAKLRDRPGELAKVAKALANLNIDIQSVFLLEREKGAVEFAFKVNDLKRAREILK
jgi:hypothetical protein